MVSSVSSATASTAGICDNQPDDDNVAVKLQPVMITASRPLSRIAIEQTPIDSAALRDNIALSMADVIGYNSSVFVKSSGRATLSTVAFRGTAPSHTAVSWNGLPVNSPSLGMTDFSLIPAYFIDQATLLHGSSALSRTSGGLGGMVDMATSADDIPLGAALRYVQGVGSFTTFDEFLQASYGSERWRVATRAVYSSSRNDFPYINRDVMENVYDDDHNIIDRYHPRCHNTNGGYRDLHLLQQVAFTPSPRHRLTLDAWYTQTRRDIALTTVDFSAANGRNDLRRERDYILRTVAAYRTFASSWSVDARLGYVSNRMAYDYAIDRGDGHTNPLSISRTHAHTFYGSASFTLMAAHNLQLEATVNATASRVITSDRAPIKPIGYDRHRTDISAAVTARWQPVKPLGVALLARQETNGGHFSPFIPALFVDYTPLPNITFKGSISRNYHAPSLNDLYFLPGGNPDLKSEKGFTYDLGATASANLGGVSLRGSVNWFDSRIHDWILWLPTNKGFFSPRNVRTVHSYGLEASAELALKPFRDAELDIRASLAQVNSVNLHPTAGDGDLSAGKQLPYIPRLSTSATATLTWRQWTLAYKLCYYSRRYVMSSNENSISGSLAPYLMNDISLARNFSWRPLDLTLKLAVNNLFNATYQTILSHPMPGINFEFFLSLTPHL